MLPPPKGERAEALGLPASGTLSAGGAAAAKERRDWEVGEATEGRGILLPARVRRSEGHIMAVVEGYRGDEQAASKQVLLDSCCCAQEDLCL